MTPDQRAALEGVLGRTLTDGEVAQIDPLLDPENRNDVAIAAILSQGRRKLAPCMMTERGVMSLLGVVDGEAFLAGLEAFAAATLPDDHPLKASHAGIKRTIGWLKADGIDIGDPLVHSLLDALVAAGFVTAPSAAAIKERAFVDDPVDMNAMSRALNAAEGRMSL